jgi:hypothetical protein
MGKIKLYLDDVRTPVDKDWVMARDYDAFVSNILYYGLENIDLISLDHDLGDSAMTEYYNNVRDNFKLDYNNINEKTGLDCCKFLVNHSMDTNIPIPLVRVHSANPIGSANMIGYINNYLKNCRLPLTCVSQEIEFTIDDDLFLSPEVRQAKWGKTKK